ncbi:MAG: TetR family transcriptional regulator [Actinomycetota bacterium]
MPEAGLRERQKRAVRNSLQTAALELFLERGFAATSVDDIAATASVSRSTFFRYFGSKEAVVFAALDARGEALARAILARPPTETPLRAFEEALIDSNAAMEDAEDERLVRDRDRVVQADPELQMRSRELTLRWQSRLATTLAQRDGHDVPRPEQLLTAAVGVAIVERLADDWRRHPNRSVETLVRSQFDLLRSIVG